MKILIQCGDHFENQNRVFILADELKKMGHHPVVMLYTNPLGNLFKTNGIEVVYYYERKKKLFKKIGNKLDGLSFSTVVGSRQISEIIEVEGKRRPEITWPSRIERTSKDAALHYYATMELVLDLCPDIIAVWNGFTGLVANTLRIIAEDLKIPSCFMERGLFKNSLFLDKKGCNGAASISSIDYNKEVKLFSEIHKNEVYKLFKDRVDFKSGKINSSNYKELIDKRIVFFPLQVTRDTNILLYSKFNSMRHAFHDIYNALNEENTVFVIRPHPEESINQAINIPRLDNVLICKDESLEFWIENSHLIVTINSTVGLEAILKNKPVISLGQSIYSSFKYLKNLDPLESSKVTSRKYNKELKKYLLYFVSSNLLIEGSEYNANVIKKQIPYLDNTLYESYSENKFSSRLKAKEYLSSIDKPKVNLAFDLSSKLNLSYTMNAVPITKEWIIKVLNELSVKNSEFLIHATEFCDIAIYNEGASFDAHAASIVLDSYGNILSIFGTHIL